MTPLLVQAAFDGDLGALEAALATSSPDIHGVARGEITHEGKPLGMAIARECGTHVDARNRSDFTPLHSAGAVEIARLRIDAGADVRANNVLGEYPSASVSNADVKTLLGEPMRDEKGVVSHFFTRLGDGRYAFLGKLGNKRAFVVGTHGPTLATVPDIHLEAATKAFLP